MNELGELVEGQLAVKGWTLGDLLPRIGITAGEALNLFGPASLTTLPDGSVMSALAAALDLPFQEVVLAAASACGVPRTVTAGREVMLHEATNDQLWRELRRRLIAGRHHGDARRRRMAHLALVGQALMLDAS
jgi:hypothetical protein